MPASSPLRINESLYLRQYLFLHIWGETSKEGLEYAKRLLRSLAEQAKMPDLPEAAMKPGGVRIKDFEWAGMSRGDPFMLNEAGFSKVGLSMAWLTAPDAGDPRGSHLTHAGLSTYLYVRCNPTRENCDLVASLRGDAPDKNRMASLLIRLAPLLGVRERMSAHEAIEAIQGNSALYAASRATSVDQLENALKMAMIQ